MEWFWIYIPLVVVAGSLLVARRKGPRDLHRAAAGQTALYRWSRIAGIGLTFSSCFEIVAILWRGQPTTESLLVRVLLAMVGFLSWFQLSEIKDGRGQQTA